MSLVQRVSGKVDHVVAGCKMLVQKEYKRRHDKVCLNLHWSVCRKFEYSASDEWYNHVPEKVLNETGKPKILWDFDIQTGRTIEHRRPDIIVHDVEKGECLIIDVAIPADKNIADKEVEKITKYAELKIEISRMWECSAAKVKVVPIVIGALGSISKKLTYFLEQLDIRTDMRVLQKSALLGTANAFAKA